jgi:fibronectin type 3 domain-containing protein
LPKTIASGQHVSITVRFTPNASGSASGKLTLTSNADNSPNTVSLGGVGVSAGSHSADLSWNPSHDPVIGYNVYRGGTKGGPYKKTNSVLEASTNYTDSTVAAGATYYYVVTAVDADSLESAYSNEVKVVIPTP